MQKREKRFDNRVAINYYLVMASDKAGQEQGIKMEQGLTKTQLNRMRKYYLEIALIDRRFIRENKQAHIASVVRQATKKENLRIASDLKKFWPVVCGVA